jgi:hypothetical protein
MMTDRRSTRQQALSRREVLKALAAIGGAAAASSLLPEKWARPVVGVGVVPAHAQSSNYVVQCHILDLAFIRDPGGAKEWVPAAGNFQLEVLGQVVPPAAGLPILIDFEVMRPYHSSNRVFLFWDTINTDSDGIARSGPLQINILSGDGVFMYSYIQIPEQLGGCTLDIQVP